MPDLTPYKVKRAGWTSGWETIAGFKKKLMAERFVNNNKNRLYNSDKDLKIEKNGETIKKIKRY